MRRLTNPKCGKHLTSYSGTLLIDPHLEYIAGPPLPHSRELERPSPNKTTAASSVPAHETAMHGPRFMRTTPRRRRELHIVHSVMQLKPAEFDGSRLGQHHIGRRAAIAQKGQVDLPACEGVHPGTGSIVLTIFHQFFALQPSGSS